MPLENPEMCKEILQLQLQISQINASTLRISELFEQHMKDDAEMTPKIDALLDAWEQGVGVAKFLKMLIPVVAGLGALWMWIETHITFSK